MKNITIKLTLAGILLINIACIEAMGRISVAAGQVMYARISRPLVRDIRQLNEVVKAPVSRFNAHFTGKGYVEKMRDSFHDQVQKGNAPSLEDLHRFDQACAMNKYGALNLPDKNGETFIKAVLEMPESKKRTSLLRALYARGAKLNIHDTFVMGPEKTLKAMLNVSLEASAWRTIKALRTFLTKNTTEKISNRFSSFNMSGNQVTERLLKVEGVKKLAKEVEPELLARRAQERVQAQRDKRMPQV